MKHFTDVELAQRWRITKGTLANWRVAGTGPKYIKLGKRVLYPLDVVEAWERAHLQTSTVDERKGE